MLPDYSKRHIDNFRFDEYNNNISIYLDLRWRNGNEASEKRQGFQSFLR